MGAVAQPFENRLARAGHFARFAAEACGQFWQRRGAMSMRRGGFHGGSMGAFARSHRQRFAMSEAMKMAMQVRTMVEPQGTLSW